MELQRENVRVNAMRFQGYVITKKRYAVLLSITCAMIYGSSYIGRLNFSAALPYMLKDNLLTKAQAALVSGGYFFSYGIGQLVNGRLTDRSQPEYRIISGCIGAACANLLMPFSGSFILMPLLWISNGFFQSMLWTPCYSLLVSSLQRKDVNRYVLILNTAPAFGSITAYLLYGGILKSHSWKNLFYTAGGIMLCACILFILLTRHVAKNSLVNTVSASHFGVNTSDNGPSTSTPALSMSQLLMVSGLAASAAAIMIHGMLKDGITAWAPSYMSECFEITASMASFLAIVPQVVNLLAAAFAYWIFRKTQDEMICAQLLFLIASCSLGILLLYGYVNFILSIICLSFTIMSMQAVNVVFVSIIPLRFSQYGKLASISGMHDALGYIGCAVSMYLVAGIADSFGWNFTILFWIIAAVSGMLICILMKRKWESFIKAKV